MEENPYQSPATTGPIKPKLIELFDRIHRYLRWAFYLGLTLLILGSISSSHPKSEHTVVLEAITIGGGILLVISLVGFLPLSMWGFIKGYKEGQANNT